MKPTKKLILSIACLGAGLALAQDGERRPPGGPGGPDGGNASSRLGEFMKSADTNADGKVNKEEYLAFAKKEAEDRFGKMDANTDGQVDQAEIAQVGQRLREMMGNRGNGGDNQGAGGFRRGGSDNGGGFRRPPGGEGAADGPTPPPPPPGGPDGGPRGDRGPGGPGGRGPGGPGMGNPDELFSKMDKNADGSVDLAEYSEPQKAEIEARFKRADSNGDGKLSKDEMIAAIRASMQMRQGQGQGGPGMRRGPGEGGPGGPGVEGGFRRPPGSGGEGSRPRPEGEGDAPKPPAGV